MELSLDMSTTTNNRCFKIYIVNSELGAVLEIESYTFQFREQQFSRQQGLDKQFSCCSYEYEVRRGWFLDLW